MNKISKKGYAILSGIIVLSLALSSLCLHFFSKADRSKQTITKGVDTDYASIERDTSISVDSNGVLQINRKEKNNEKIMGNEDTWTIFMYLCGSNLESDYLSATTDIKEILAANINPDNMQNVNIIIQTGGCSLWHYKDISDDKIQRYKVDGETKDLTLVQELGNADMGSASTLYDYLDWGVTNYPAEHMGVIFWDHGSGVSNGVCADEQFDNSSLSVHELEYTFAKLNKKMDSKFEMISFDTCLSGSLEYANILAPYAKYMVASADIEPGDGWSYTEIINHLLNNPDSTGAELGKVICDSYAKFYDEESSYSSRPINYTLATYDLSKATQACVETNYLTKYLYDKLANDSSEYWNQAEFRSSFLRYAYDNVDIGSILDCLDTSNKYDYNTTYFKKAIDDLVIYSRLSSVYESKKAKCITLYSPISALSLANLNTYRNVCFSPYWLKYIELMNFKTMCNNMNNNFKVIPWESSPYFFEPNFNFINYDYTEGMGFDINSIVNNILVTNSDYYNSGFPSIWYENITNSQGPNQYGFYPRTIDSDMKIERNDNVLSSQITKDNINKVKNVYNTIFTKMNNTLVCLGQNNKVSYNQTTGEVKSNFNEEWFMLPDGQLLTAYIISQNNTSTVYSFPVMINDSESSIRIEETTSKDGTVKYTTLGVWDSSDSKYTNDKFTRGYLPLKSGTAITPIYDVFDLDSDKYETEYGEEYIINGEFEFLFGKLEPGEYTYSYEVEKLDNTSIYSELKDFSTK